MKLARAAGFDLSTARYTKTLVPPLLAQPDTIQTGLEPRRGQDSFRMSQEASLGETLERARQQEVEALCEHCEVAY